MGSRWKPEPPLALAAVLRTGSPARSDDYSQASGASGDAIRRMGIYGMFFIALLALLRIAQRRTTAAALAAEVDTIQRTEPNPARLSA